MLVLVGREVTELVRAAFRSGKGNCGGILAPPRGLQRVDEMSALECDAGEALQIALLRCPPPWGAPWQVYACLVQRWATEGAKAPALSHRP